MALQPWRTGKVILLKNKRVQPDYFLYIFPVRSFLILDWQFYMVGLFMRTQQRWRSFHIKWPTGTKFLSSASSLPGVHAQLSINE